MQWNRWYVAKSYLNSALWIVPLVALLLENVVIRLVFVLHSWLDWIPWFGTTVAGATEALNTVESLASAFIVFTFGSLLIVIQVASGQLTPLLIATILLRNNVIRFMVGLFTFTMMFAVGTGARFRYRGAEICGNNRVGPRHRINSGVLLLDRLYGTVAAASQHRPADRRRWDQSYRKRLSRVIWDNRECPDTGFGKRQRTHH